MLPNASFVIAVGMESQLGYVILMTDWQRRANIVHYRSSRCHRVSSSVMAAEVHARVHAFDYGNVICQALVELLRHIIEIEAFVDSCTLFNFVAKNSSTAERWPQINIFALRESHRKWN